MSEERKDLAAMVGPLARTLLAVEEPILRAHDLSMWGYVVLLGLGDEPTRTQAALASAIGADKTRIIPVLDELQRRQLIERTADPNDRRVRLLSLTGKGKRLRDAVRGSIRRKEEALLSRLSAADRRAFLRALRTLSEVPAEEVSGARADD